MPSAPASARSLREDSPGWANLKAGAWFRCDCGRIGHISELLYVDNETTLWCPQCKEDDWNWAQNGVVKKT
jgi:hypothetical protein